MEVQPISTRCILEKQDLSMDREAEVRHSNKVSRSIHL
jgi:hypothetical protein